jgi:hypothetical protein
MIKLTLKDAATGQRILPAYYSENYVSLLPGEERGSFRPAKRSRRSGCADGIWPRRRSPSTDAEFF